MTDPNARKGDRDYQPTREELEADISIDAEFDEVMDAIIAGHGTD